MMMKSRSQRFILLILLLQSLAAFLVIFFMPSEEGSFILLWFSKSRLILVAGFFIVLVCQFIASLYLFRHPHILTELAGRLETVKVPFLIMGGISFIIG